MARETTLTTEPTHSADASRRGPASPATARRRGRGRRVAAGLGVLCGLVAAGLFALPRAELPPGDFRVEAGGHAVGRAAARYGASPPHRWLLGGGYRELWATPVRVPVLDLRTFAGGLTPERRGGGNQTRSLRFRGTDGRGYVFRSVDKDQGGRLGPLARAVFGRVRQDQVSALLPGAARVSDGLQDAAGVPHVEPRLVVMPDDPALGPHRADFAGLLGMIEENPADGFAGAARVVDTEELAAELRARPADSVDARAYLAARLMDVYLGDWDRHEGQWRWGRVEGGRWIPIPRDRDYAFADYEGLLPGLARRVDPKIVRFDGEIRDLHGLMVEAQPLDSLFLCPLPAAAWDSAAASLRAALTDAAITSAVRQLPAEYTAAVGAELGATLRTRRERLPAVARDYRRRLHVFGPCASH